MKRINMRQRIFDLLTVLGLAAVTLGLVVFPSPMVEAARDGVELCFNVIIPSLFPFFVISALTVELGLAEKLGRLMAPVMRPLFHVGGNCASALVLGFIGGYPVGARTVISLYEGGKCSRAEAERMLAFCNNSGPAFIFGVVGAGIFASGKVGLILYLAHIAASILVGLLFRSWGPRSVTLGSARSNTRPAPFPEAFVRSVGSSFTTALGICGFVIFFTVFIRLLFLSGVLRTVTALLGALGLDESWAGTLLTGIIELTSGVWSLREVSAGIPSSIAMAAFMLGWAGLSVHCQVLSFIGSTGLSVKTYILGKLLHGLISAGLVMLLTAFISVDGPVAAVLAEQVGDIAGLTFPSALRASAILSAGILLIFSAVSYFSVKISGKTRNKGV